MNPEDLVIIDYTSMLKSPPPPIANPPIDSKDSSTDDPIIKLNQAWEKEVKSRDIFTDWIIMEMKKKWEKYSRIGSVIPGFNSKSFVMKPDIDIDIQPQQTPLKV